MPDPKLEDYASGLRAYMYILNFHLRPSRSIAMSLVVDAEHFLWEGLAGCWTFPAAASISVDGKKLAERIRLENLIGDRLQSNPLAVPFECAKGANIEVSIDNRSEKTRKWNRGQIVLVGKVWD